MKPSSTADADIFCVNRLLQSDKSLMKTESLLSTKSSLKPSSTADDEIFNIHGLLLAEKALTKSRSLGPKNHTRSLGLRLMMTSSIYMDYCSSETVDEN